MEPEFSYHLLNSPPFLSILIRMNPVRAIISSVFVIKFNAVLISTSRSCKWSPYFQFPRQNSVCISRITIHVTSHLPRVNHPNAFWRGEKLMKRNAVEFFLLSCCCLPLKSLLLPQQLPLRHSDPMVFP
jgi:hypothetical protein